MFLEQWKQRALVPQTNTHKVYDLPGANLFSSAL